MKKGLFILWCLCLLFVGCESDEKDAEMELISAPIFRSLSQTPDPDNSEILLSPAVRFLLFRNAPAAT